VFAYGERKQRPAEEQEEAEEEQEEVGYKDPVLSTGFFYRMNDS